MISNIGHSVSTSGWETTITGKMMADMPDFYKRSGKKLGAGLEDYQELFRLTSIGEADTANINAFQTAQVELDKLESKNAYEKIRSKISVSGYEKFFLERDVLNAGTRLGMAVAYRTVRDNQAELINKWEKYLEALKAIDPDNAQIITITDDHNKFLKKYVVDFLDDNKDFEYTRIRKAFQDGTAKAIFQSIKNSFKI